jgi:hypothetical protein
MKRAFYVSGLILPLFGLVMFSVGERGTATAKLAEATAEG